MVARDSEGWARGFLHWVPCASRPALSLSLMRADHDAPNGVTEFLLVASFQDLAARGIEQLSLNFAAGARFIHEPNGSGEVILGKGASWCDHMFQLESLYRFNAKFDPE